MTGRLAFSLEEWNNLTVLAWSAAILVIYADRHLSSMVGEIRAFWKALDHPDAGAAQHLVEALIADAVRDDDDLPEGLYEERDRGVLLQRLRDGADTVDRVCTVDEAADLKRWVMSVARTTAEARREGRFMGIGGPRVSDQEQAMLDEIERALGS